MSNTVVRRNSSKQGLQNLMRYVCFTLRRKSNISAHTDTHKHRFSTHAHTHTQLQYYTCVVNNSELNWELWDYWCLTSHQSGQKQNLLFMNAEEEEGTSPSRPQEHRGLTCVKGQRSPDLTFRWCGSSSCIIFRLSVLWMRTLWLETEDLRVRMFSGDEPTLGVIGVRVRVGVRLREGRS